MTAEEIIAYIGSAEKKTPVKVYVNERSPIDYGAAKVFGEGRSKVIFGDWRDLGPILSANAQRIADSFLTHPDRVYNGLLGVLLTDDEGRQQQ